MADGRWYDLLLPTIPATIIGGAGFWVVHHLSVRRQRRDEFFKLTQTARDQLHQAESEAIKTWRKPGSDQDAQENAVNVVHLCARLGRTLGALKRRRPEFDTKRDMAIFRKIATEDIEDPKRDAAPDRTHKVAHAASRLDERVDALIFRIFG